MDEKKKQIQSTPVNRKKPIAESFRKINKEAAIGIMKHKDGTIEKRKL